MDQNVEDAEDSGFAENNQPKTIPAHKYPILIWLSFILLIAIFMYSLIEMPRYVEASYHYKKGKTLYDSGRVNESIIEFEKSIALVEEAKNTKIQIAMALFSNGDPSDDEGGLYYLQNITLVEDEWKAITKVMPKEYVEYFGDAGGK